MVGRGVKDMDVIAVSFGENESSQLNEADYAVKWFNERGFNLDLDKDHLHDFNGNEATCSLMGPFIVFKEREKPFPDIIFEYILGLTDHKGVVSMMEQDDNEWPIPDSQADLYLADFIASIKAGDA